MVFVYKALPKDPKELELMTEIAKRVYKGETPTVETTQPEEFVEEDTRTNRDILLKIEELLTLILEQIKIEGTDIWKALVETE